MKYDLLVIGAGPAGLTAAIHARARGKSALVVSNDPLSSPLSKAPAMANYPGLPGVTGAEPVENDAVEGRAVILAPGVSRAAPLKGESELLGRGVSYCATCDGMFYRGKRVVCAGDAPNFDEEVEFLRSIGCQVSVTRLAGLSILGTDRVTGVRDAKGDEISCDGVFLLRSSIAPARLAPGLETEEGYIKVDGRMATNLRGVYAAGDCTGQPLQLAKAVGQGQAAAHFAIEAMG